MIEFDNNDTMQDKCIICTMSKTNFWICNTCKQKHCNDCKSRNTSLKCPFCRNSYDDEKDDELIYSRIYTFMDSNFELNMFNETITDLLFILYKLEQIIYNNN